MADEPKLVAVPDPIEEIPVVPMVEVDGLSISARPWCVDEPEPPVTAPSPAIAPARGRRLARILRPKPRRRPGPPRPGPIRRHPRRPPPPSSRPRGGGGGAAHRRAAGADRRVRRECAGGRGRHRLRDGLSHGGARDRGRGGGPRAAPVHGSPSAVAGGSDHVARAETAVVLTPLGGRPRARARGGGAPRGDARAARDPLPARRGRPRRRPVASAPDVVSAGSSSLAPAAVPSRVEALTRGLTAFGDVTASVHARRGKRSGPLLLPAGGR